MARSDEAAAFFAAVYSAVQEIPYGKVTSYGHIAKLIGTRKSFSFLRHRPTIAATHKTAYVRTLRAAQRPRQVGVCLKHLPEDDSVFNNDNVPWQRVINSKGIVSPRYVSGEIRRVRYITS